MDERLQLHELLVAALGSENVHFQPPSSTELRYPCIIYERDRASTNHADNAPWSVKRGYSVTLIDHDPDSPVLEKIERIPSCVFSRHFTTDQLNHDVFNIFI